MKQKRGSAPERHNAPQSVRTALSLFIEVHSCRRSGAHLQSCPSLSASRPMMDGQMVLYGRSIKRKNRLLFTKLMII
jgi:hypothetical protein